MKGVCEFFDPRGFGQIIGDDHNIYRVNRAELLGMRSLATGSRVEFTPIDTPSGPRAREVRPCEASAPVIPKEAS